MFVCDCAVCVYSGTAAIGPIISALKDGKSVTYEGREVNISKRITASVAVAACTHSRTHSRTREQKSCHPPENFQFEPSEDLDDLKLVT